MAKQSDPRQTNFLWRFSFLATENNSLAPSGKRKKKRKKTKPSPAQTWAYDLFVRPRTTMQTPGIRYYATGCSCSFIIKSGSTIPSLCSLHDKLQEAYFEDPEEEILAIEQRKKAKAKYFSLPMAPLSAEVKWRLNQVAIPWFQLKNQGLGRPKNWKGKRFTLEPCGCVFIAREVKTSRIEGKYRAGHYWYAIKVRECHSIDRDCEFEHLPIKPRLGAGQKVNREH